MERTSGGIEVTAKRRHVHMEVYLESWTLVKCVGLHSSAKNKGIWARKRDKRRR
jgi:hypothetical protein